MLPPTSRSRPQVDPDEAVRSTDDDAAASRLSAVNLGYLDDPFVSYLYRPKYGESSASGALRNSRKPPLINVGTHHRTYAIDILVDQFLQKGGKQVVSLGAGSDTRFWRLMSRNNRPNITKYVEIDFPHLTSTKAQRISRSPKLSAMLAHDPSSADATTSSKPYMISKGGTQLSSEIYSLLPLDLKGSPATTLSAEVLPLLDPSLPTLFLAECVLCYLHPEVGEEIISWFGETFANCAGVIYEMCGLNGTFGQVMKRNLAARNLTLPGAIFSDPAAQAARFSQQPEGSRTNFETAGGKDLWDIRETVIYPEELSRIAKLEHLDEIEELRLVLSHYCVAWGGKGTLAGIGL